MAARFYKCPKTGNKLPSVTTICGQLDKPALIHWAANCACEYIINELEQFCVPSNPNEEENHSIELEMLFPIIESARKNFRKVSAKAMDIGSAAHAAIERYLKTGQEPEAPSDEVLSAFLAFLEWLDTWESYETVKTEHTVYADRYAGTTDWFVMLNGKKYAIDFKTYNEESKSQPPYDEAKYQIAGYRATDETIKGCGLLYLGKLTGKQKWVDTSDTYEQDLKIFNILTDLWYAKEGSMEGKELVPEVKFSIEEVKKYIAPKATEKELYMFLNICNSYGLNPFKREIHFVKYGDNPGQTIVGYEVYLKRAERTGQLDGWNVKIIDKGKETERAEVTIHRKDQKHPLVWEAFRSEFDKKQSTWKVMPQFMLKKVAVAQGFRLAFPIEMGGMPYIPEEINVGSSETLPTSGTDSPQEAQSSESQKPKAKPLNKAQGEKIIAIAANHERSFSADEAKEIIDWYCNDPENKHNGRTFESGQALIHGFSTILDRFLDHKEKETNNV